jgi:hypothetical protein
VQSASACATAENYHFREAEVTLLRGRRPVSVTNLVQTAEVDLTALAPLAQPGDRIYVFVLYENLYSVGAKGEGRTVALSSTVAPPTKRPPGQATDGGGPGYWLHVDPDEVAQRRARRAKAGFGFESARPTPTQRLSIIRFFSGG